MTEPVLAARSDLLVCDECDAVHQRIDLQHGTVARCRRCNAMLGRGHMLRMQTLLAYSLGALLLLVVANSAPIVTLELRGVVIRATLPESIRHTWGSGQPLVAVLTALTAQVFPAAFTLLRIYLLIPLMQGVVPRGFVPAMRALDFVTRWSMVEVFMMGTLVAVVRGATLTTTTAGIGLFAYGALALLLTAITAAGTHTLWKRGSALGPAQPEGARA
ncbi:MAG TPA: paraquat-inducible protein A [Rhizobacter sp.]|nr:paraquat-inducible protein A [Rhizobacter sp.]